MRDDSPGELRVPWMDRAIGSVAVAKTLVRHSAVEISLRHSRCRNYVRLHCGADIRELVPEVFDLDVEAGFVVSRENVGVRIRIVSTRSEKDVALHGLMAAEHSWIFI